MTLTTRHLVVVAASAAVLLLTQCASDAPKASADTHSSPNQIRRLSQDRQTIDGQEVIVNRWVVTENPLETWSEVVPVKKVSAPAGR